MQHNDASPIVISRRSLLRGAGAGLLGLCLSCRSRSKEAAPSLVSLPARRPPAARVGLVYVHGSPDLPVWPHQGFDYPRRKGELSAMLRRGCPNTIFEEKTVGSPEQARRVIAELDQVDGLLVYFLGMGAVAVPELLTGQKPTIVIDDLYGGTLDFLCAAAFARVKQLPVVTVAFSDERDVQRTARLFEVLKAIRTSKLVVGRGASSAPVSPEHVESVSKAIGIQLLPIPLRLVESAYQHADETRAIAWASSWIRGARRIVEPTREEVIKSARLHLALCAILRELGADGITLDCLGGFRDRSLPAYPCLSYHQLNNEGLVGACEADVNSAAAMIMIRQLTGRPGFISDPVFDLSTRQIIYAHCTAPTRPLGPDGLTSPYLLRSHAEDNRGASIQALLPVGQPITTLNVVPTRRVLTLHAGQSVGNIDSPRGCRTKLAATAKVDKVLERWRWGKDWNLWHRVTVFGDWRDDLKRLAKLMSLQVLEEDA